MGNEMNENPFSLNFGKEPFKLISRQARVDEIVDTFQSDNPSTSTYLITGVRGSGKTVTMMSVINELKKDKNWITVTLNPARDLLEAFAANLYETPAVKPAFIKADIGINFVVNATLSTKEPAIDVDVSLKKMLKIIDRLGMRVLIAIDEVTKSNNIRVFSGSYQMLLGEGYPVFLLMTGLYENIRNIQDDKSLTFLYRAPRIELKPLSLIGMSRAYKDVFDISDDEADAMAVFTKGYSYAFQVLGYIRYKRKKPLDKLIAEFDEIMSEYSYEKIWSELSARDHEIVKLLALNGRMRVKDVQEKTGMTSGAFSTYRQRLGRGGIVSLEEYGYCEIMLPRFAEIIKRWQ